jgi:serine/threonine-protein kinase
MASLRDESEDRETSPLGSRDAVVEPETQPVSEPGRSQPQASVEETLAAPTPPETQVGSVQSGSSWGTGSTSGFTGELRPGLVVFDKYLVIRLLGQGGMGAVWLVRHRDLDIERAVKVIVGGISTDAVARARLKREARVMARFSHPNAVAVHDARMTEDAAFIEMDYVQGKPLGTVLKSGVPMPLDWTARILQQLCEVLQVAHDHGIVHRDLKPSNLMLVDGRAAGNEFLKVLDFGIAKLFGPAPFDGDEFRTRTGHFMGTAPYASPDQLHGGEVDGRSDIYSVGVILYEFLTGHRPFSGPSTLYDHLHTAPPPFADKNANVRIPHEVEQLVMRCLAKNPTDRPQSARDLSEAFLRAAGAGVATAPFGSAVSSKQVDSPSDPALQTTERFTAASSSLPRTELIQSENRVRRRLSPYRIAAGLAFGILAIGVAQLLITRGGSTVRQDNVPPLQPTATSATATTSRRAPAFPPEGFLVDSSARVLGSIPGAIARSRPAARFVFVEGGEFLMGNWAKPSAELADTQPAHRVRVSSFYLQESEVTNGELIAYFRDKAIGKTEWPEKFREAWDRLIGDLTVVEAERHPAVGISHKLAEEFAHWGGGRLPTEAEWEFAARSRGQQHAYVWGNAPEPSERLANIDTAGNLTTPTQPVRSYHDDKTEQGVFDLTGNVREWCADHWLPYASASSETLVNPVVRESKTAAECVIRGGSFKTDLEHAATTYRSDRALDYHTDNDLGFRIVIETPKPAVEKSPGG